MTPDLRRCRTTGLLRDLPAEVVDACGAPILNPLMALGAVGSMQRVIEATVAYALERNAFGRQIGHFQAIRHKLAEMALKLETGRSLTYHALRLFHDGQDAIKEVTMAKLATQRAAFEGLKPELPLAATGCGGVAGEE